VDRPYSLVRAEVDFDANRIRFYALRRREPGSQPPVADRSLSVSSSWLSLMIANSHMSPCLHTTCHRNTSQVTFIL